MMADTPQICRLEGTMSPQARDATIQHFSTCDLSGMIFLSLIIFSKQRGRYRVSCQSQGWRCVNASLSYQDPNCPLGVALNLTEASRVYLMDSWWNPAVQMPQFISM